MRMPWVLSLLDIVCFVAHTALILFNMVGWLWRRTRVLHLATMSLTAFSWFVMGAYYGWGYCICADWHFHVRRELGHQDSSTSYIQLLLEKVMRIEVSSSTADGLAGVVFALIVMAMAVVWTNQWRRRRGSAAATAAVR